MIDPSMYKSLGLTDEEYGLILKIMEREPTVTELAMFSVAWSEHCGYTCSRPLLRELPKTGKYPVLVGEDSGGIVVDGKAVIFKIESHNHPSQVEPKQGAATGVGGIVRDIFTAGARPVAILNSLRFGLLDAPRVKYLVKGVVDGIQFYGNCIGVPTVAGEVYFDDCYNQNCLVNAMCVGIADENKLARAKAHGAGNAVIYVGARTGRDGIGGCSVLASQEFGRDEEKRPAVQVGDPFMEKCLIEATLEALDSGYIVGIKDMGAAGLTCASNEMASAGNSGMEIDLDKVPLREDNMRPWEIMLSESQERMLACVKRGHEEHITGIFNKWGLESVVIGRVIDDKVLRIKSGGETIVEVNPDALADAPEYNMPCSEPGYVKTQRGLKQDDIPLPGDYNRVLLSLLDIPSLSCKRWVYEQYDYMVQTNTLILPGSDASVLRIKGTDKAIAVTTDCNSLHCFLNPFRGAQLAVAEAARNCVCSGADPAGITDCLNFGNPKKPDRFWQFKRCIEGITDASKFFNLPVVSGNVSFYNEGPEKVIFPTPVIGMLGIIHDSSKICGQWFRRPGDRVILIGRSRDELNGSVYLKDIVKSKILGDAPVLDLRLEKSVQEAVLESIRERMIDSAHDCSEGGLAFSLAESCVSGPGESVGVRIDLAYEGIRPDSLLFGETASRVIVSCRPERVEEVQAVAQKHGAPCLVIGEVGGDCLSIRYGADILIDLPCGLISSTWNSSFGKGLTG